MTSAGEEATAIGSAAALTLDDTVSMHHDTAHKYGHKANPPCILNDFRGF